MDDWSIVILSLLVLIFPSFRRVYFRKKPTTPAPQLRGREQFFDVLKGVSIIAVVLIHVVFFLNHTKGLVNNELLLVVLNNLSRFAIPIFFICSGILLKPVKTKAEWLDFYKRKLLRIFFPYLLVVIFLFLVEPTSITTFLYELFAGKASIPFYFVVVLLQLYLLFPLLSRFRDKKGFLVSSFMISVLFLLSPLPLAPFGFTLFFKFLFFFSYGIYFRDYFLDYKQDIKELYIWWLIVAAYLLLVLAFPEKYYNHRYFYGLAIFNLLFYYKDKILNCKKLSNFLASFGKYSLWIFLIHFELMILIYPWIIHRGWNYYVVIIFFFIDSLIISYFGAVLCSWLYNKFIKYLTKKI